ncbi:MAG: GDSL-type esterase/lipase family protein, partial [Vicinamibacterales bacterium]
LGARRVLIVTDRLHMRRAAGAFEQLGFAVQRASVPIYEGHADNVSMLASGLREMVALAYYRMRGWAESGSPQPVAVASNGVKTPDVQVHNPDGPIVVLGASYAGGWSGLTRVGDVPVINSGVAGQQSFEMLERFERDVVPARPRAVILWGFINDIFRADQDVNGAMARARDSYTGMIALARQHGIEPIVATEVTIRPQATWTTTLASIAGALRGKESYQYRINRHVIATNQWLVDLARREGLLLLDLQSTLAEEGGRRRPEFTQEDGSHISPAGYDALTRYARPILERHFEAR